MNIKDVQMILAAAGAYSGAIDGDLGPKTRAGMATVLQGRGLEFWPEPRRVVAAVQVLLAKWGHQPGPVDGYEGHNTREALIAWQGTRYFGTPVEVPRVPLAKAPRPPEVPRQRDAEAFYGPACTEANMEAITLPFDMRIDWALDQTTRRITVHRSCGPSLLAALVAVRDHYGLGRMRELGIDRYAGGYNPRRMRGGSAWSMHAYGCAIDLFAAPNALRMRCPQALFCGPDYAALLDIMQAHGWLPAIRLWGGDAMHFQRASL